MPTATPTVSVDLVRAALRSEDVPRDYPHASLLEAAERYEKFLNLVAKHPDVPLAPTRDIDMMWHLHMLSPRAYHADCVRLFGDILDHDGGFGATEEERDELERCFADTAARWEKEYGESYLGNHEEARCKQHCQVKQCKRKTA